MKMIRAVALWLARLFAGFCSAEVLSTRTLVGIEESAHRIRDELWRYKDETSLVYRDRNTKEAYDKAGDILNAVAAHRLVDPRSYERKGAA